MAAALKSEVKLHKQTAEVEEECKCLNWAELYASGTVKCGDGLEFYENFMHDLQHPSKLEDWKTWDYSTQGWEQVEYDEMCTWMYPKLNSTRCNGLSPRELGHWCYVSSACKTLNSGEAVNSQVSWKKCVSGVDPDFSDMPPKELFKVGGSPAVWIPYAYEIPPMIGKTMLDPEQLYSQLTEKEMAEIVAKGKPVYYHDDTHHTSGHVIYKNEIWRIGGAEDPAGHWATSAAACEKGCE